MVKHGTPASVQAEAAFVQQGIRQVRYNAAIMIGASEAYSQVNVARTLLKAGHLADAVELADILSIIAPNYTEVIELLVDIAMQQGNGTRTLESRETLISTFSQNHEYHGKAGGAHDALVNNLEVSGNHLLRALQLKPDYLDALIDLCKVARSLGYYDESVRAGTAALGIEPDGLALHSNLARFRELCGLHQKAREHYERAAILCPGDEDAQQKAWVACLYKGAKDEAKRYFEKAIAFNLRRVPAHRAIAVINKYVTAEHEGFARMQALLESWDGTDDDRYQFHFALGKMCDDCSEYDRAFERFDAGNRLANPKHDFDPSEYHRYVDRLITIWKSVRLQHIRDIQYEMLVRDQEQKPRRLLEFLGLPWGEHCLRFLESERSVHTASHSQLRTTMHSRFIGRWNHYEKHLEPLHRGLRWPKGSGD